MPVLVVTKVKGDPDALVRAYDEVMSTPKARDQPTRPLQQMARTDYGMLVVDVWDSREAFLAGHGDPELTELFERIGMDDQETEIWELDRTMVAGEEAPRRLGD